MSDPAEDVILAEMWGLTQVTAEFKPRPFRNPDNRWLVRSAIQKAIRRGQTDYALATAEPLYDYDPSQIWRTLQTILIEDVGFGDLDLISYSCVATIKSVRDKLGPEALFAGMVKRACASVKTQSCCELSFAEWDPSLETHRQLFRGLSEKSLINRMKNQDLPRAYLAATALRKNLRHQGWEALTPALTMIRDNLAPDSEAARAAMLSFERTADNMSLALFPVLMGQQRHHEEEIFDEEPFPPEVVINSIRSCAYDMHTLQGKRAIKAYYNWLCKEGHAEWAIKIPDKQAVRAIGALVFMVEGGLLDQRIRSDWLNNLQKYQWVIFCHHYGIPDELLAEPGLHQMQVDVRETIWRLNECRQWSASL